MGQPVTTVRRMRLGMELRRMRENARVSQNSAADAIDGSDTKISRVEAGRTSLTRLELDALLDLYGITDREFRTGLLELNRTARQRGWWQQRGDVMAPKLQELIELETTATRIFEYEPIVIPGLFQTREYAHAVISGFPPPTDLTVEDAVRIRLDRQPLLEQPDAPWIVCVLDEAVLHRRIGSRAVMADQLGKLIEVNRLPRVSIRVVPYSSGAHAGTDGSFRLFGYSSPVDMDIVFLEQKQSRIFIEDEADLVPYRVAAEQLCDRALTPEASERLIAAIAADFHEDQQE
ncbi:helix-turn-helix transcriptional regulator [Streptomyces sp. ST2-7A]|uniref:helix-turn-helix domain-containing protein n=1 Tax=Streptomyces sp. ST2-7A TaxID=2907214 RepID=UPI001F2DA706|nr:helix-turn-helix transcriptional regulator [Streptomyces sp. ST2-7A]MCE7082409.1 helix-turn-helix domain-containing protein [Streptomyces sp. ST2-7A]